MNFKDTVELVGKGVDAVGVAVVVIGIIAATAAFAVTLRGSGHGGGGGGAGDAYTRYRQGIGKAILLGLEFLVAADIIRTVAVSPTFRSAGVLAIIVLIRTFLSLSLEVELEGRLPWQQKRAS